MKLQLVDDLGKDLDEQQSLIATKAKEIDDLNAGVFYIDSIRFNFLEKIIFNLNYIRTRVKYITVVYGHLFISK